VPRYVRFGGQADIATAMALHVLAYNLTRVMNGARSDGQCGATKYSPVGVKQTRRRWLHSIAPRPIASIHYRQLTHCKAIIRCFTQATFAELDLRNFGAATTGLVPA
jgi:hypothetical protein